MIPTAGFIERGEVAATLESHLKRYIFFASYVKYIIHLKMQHKSKVPPKFKCLFPGGTFRLLQIRDIYLRCASDTHSLYISKFCLHLVAAIGILLLRGSMLVM